MTTGVDSCRFSDSTQMAGADVWELRRYPTHLRPIELHMKNTPVTSHGYSV